MNRILKKVYAALLEDGYSGTLPGAPVTSQTK